MSRPIEAVIFDLDNCLYDERVYLESAYRRIADFLSDRSSFSNEDIYSKLKSDFCRKGSMYPRLFNDLLADLGLDENLVDDVLDLFSSVDADIGFFPEAENVLLELGRRGVKLGLVTNGGVGVQRNKVRLLGLEKFFDVVVYAREVCCGSEKPNSEVYRVTLEKLGVKAEVALCVGDNPYTDFLGAKKLGMRTLRLRQGEFRDVSLGHEYEAEFVLGSLDGFFEVLNKINC